jgi:uncharacterized membrane protein
MELVALFLVLAFALGAVGLLIALPIIAIVRTHRIAALSERLQHLERELRRLRQDESGSVAAVQGNDNLQERVLALEQQVQQLWHDAGETAVARPARAERPRAPAHLPPKRDRISREHASPVHRAETDWTAVETWIGARGLGWAAIVLLIFAVGFFLKHVFDRNLIGELGRVSIGIALGSALTVGGYAHHRRGWRLFGQMLTAGGVALLYLATFASFGYYRLLDQEPAAVFLTIIVAEAFLLAVLYDAPAIALLAVVGGLLAPILLHTDEDRYRSLFAYLILLDAGVVALVLFRAWWIVASLALVGTHALFWLWHWEHYHPAKLAMCLVFHGAIFTLFAGQGLLRHLVRRQPANVEELIRVLLNACLIAFAGYMLLDDNYHPWMGSLSLAMASCFALQAWLADWSEAPDRTYSFALLAVAMAFLAMVFPLQADAVWIAVGWAVQGLVLWWFGLRIRSLPLRGIAVVLLALATGRLLIVNTLIEPPHTVAFVPIFNAYGLPALVIAGSLIAAALLVRRLRPEFGSLDFVSMRTLGLAGVVLGWIVFSVEAHDYFMVRIDQPRGTQMHGAEIEQEMEPARWEAYRADRETDLRYTAQVAMSVVWAVYAALVLVAGFRFNVGPLRWLALGLFGLTLLKVVVVDMGRLPGFYRVAAFFALSLMMASAAWGYQKLKHVLTPETGGDS